MLTDNIIYMTIFKITLSIQIAANLPDEGYIVLNGTDLYFLDGLLKIREILNLDNSAPSSTFTLTASHNIESIRIYLGPMLDGYVEELIISKINGKVIMKKKHESDKNVRELYATLDNRFLFQSDGSRLTRTDLLNKDITIVFDKEAQTEIWGLQHIQHKNILIFASSKKESNKCNVMAYSHQNSSVSLVKSFTNRPLKYIYDSFTKSYIAVNTTWSWDKLTFNEIHLFNNRFVRIYNRRICLMNRNDLMEILSCSPQIEGERLSIAFYGIENYSTTKNNATLRRGFILYNISNIIFLDIGMKPWFNLKLNATGLNYAVNMAHNSSHWIIYWLKKGSKTFNVAVVSKFDYSVHWKDVNMAGASSGKSCFNFNSQLLIFVGDTKIRKYDTETFRGEMIDFELDTGPLCTVSHVRTERAFYYTLCHELKKTVLLKKYDTESDRVSLMWESSSIYCPPTIYIDPITKEIFALVYQEGIFRGHLSGPRFKKMLGGQEFHCLAVHPLFLYTFRKGNILKIDRIRGDIVYYTEPFIDGETKLLGFDVNNNYLSISTSLRFWLGLTVISVCIVIVINYDGKCDKFG